MTASPENLCHDLWAQMEQLEQLRDVVEGAEKEKVEERYAKLVDLSNRLEAKYPQLKRPLPAETSEAEEAALESLDTVWQNILSEAEDSVVEMDREQERVRQRHREADQARHRKTSEPLTLSDQFMSLNDEPLPADLGQAFAPPAMHRGHR